ncbi:MAG: hypothetical protein FJ398_14975 [Verrucomicrobia bacterium]|nr:hypothetical protein [Verrucomicrobiota bacterium]
MKLPRNAKIFRGQLDAAPFAGVFFLLLIFLTLSSTLVFSPGIKINLPEVREPLGGSEGPTVVVAIDAAGMLYHDNQAKTEDKLRKDLAAAVQASREPPTLEILADKAARLEIAYRLMGFAEGAGFKAVHCVVRSQPLPNRAK